MVVVRLREAFERMRDEDFLVDQLYRLLEAESGPVRKKQREVKGRRRGEEEGESQRAASGPSI